MSVQPVNLHLGLGELFFKRDTDVNGKYMSVGTLKGKATFAYEMATAEQKPGNRLTVARRDKISEKATLTVEVIDLKIPQLIAALGLSISTTQITVTTSMRVFDEIAFGSTTTTKTLALTAISMTSVVAISMDRSTKYARGTDFTLPSTTKIKPISASFKQKSNFVAYNSKMISATTMRVGDKFKLQQVSLMYTTKLSSGKFISIIMPYATVIGGLTLPFGEAEYTMYNLVFAAIGDMTAASGTSLFKIARQQ